MVRVERSGPWDWSRDMRQQDGWAEHARFMDGIADEGFLLMAGPVEGSRETMWIVEADAEETIRTRMAKDPWAANGMLRPVRVERWDVVIDTLSQARESSSS